MPPLTNTSDRPAENASSAKTRPFLVVVGTGIQWGGQATVAARRAIERADRVLFAVGDPWAVRWIRALSPEAESLPYPRDGTPRRAIYRSMVDRILAPLREGQRVCAAFYGSASLLNRPAHDAVRRAREEVFRARMLPGVSSLECLFSDLGLDPGESGCQVFEAGDYLIRARVCDPSAHLVLCQIAVIGNRDVFDPLDTARIRHGLHVLEARLARTFPCDHEVVVYEAACHPLSHPRIDRIRLRDLAGAAVSEISTLYVPPLGPARVDEEMLARLGGPADSTTCKAPIAT